MSQTRQAIEELRSEIEANIGPQARCAALVERISRYLREAVAANDMKLVQGYAEELGRNASSLGRDLAAPPQTTGKTKGAA